MEVVPEVRRPGRTPGPWRVAAGLPLLVAGLVVALGAPFVRGRFHRPRPPGEPARWKVVVWVVMFVFSIPGMAVLTLVVHGLVAGG